MPLLDAQQAKGIVMHIHFRIGELPLYAGKQEIDRADRQDHAGLAVIDHGPIDAIKRLVPQVIGREEPWPHPVAGVSHALRQFLL